MIKITLFILTFIFLNSQTTDAHNIRNRHEHVTSGLSIKQTTQNIKGDDERVFMTVEEKPEYPGGKQMLLRFLKDNIRYPKKSLKNNSQGKTIISFIINNDGSITDINIEKSCGDKLLDKEAKRVVSIMPKWKPGKQNGKAVRTKYVIPVTFQLQNKSLNFISK